MWSVLPARPLDVLSARRITLFFLAILMAVFVNLTVGTVSSQAQTADNNSAVWSGENVEYGGQTLQRYDDTLPDLNDSRFPNRAGTPCENSSTLFYSEILPEPAVELPDPEYREDRYWMHLICLDADTDTGDLTQPITATLVDYSLLKDGVEASELRGGMFDTRVVTDIQILPEGSATSTGEDEPATSCDSEHTKGLGWLICPVTRWLSAGMDLLFNVLESFLIVQPLSTDRDTPIYMMWSLVRNLANILFIVGFLIIIYSQISSVGLSNYGIKRLLPRLIIAAVLVNISYWITAIAVDLSNLIGVSLKDALDQVEEQLKQLAPGDIGKLTWEGFAGAALTGGVAAAAAAGLVFSVVASAGGSLFFLLVVLMGGIISLLVAILVLAARQALITILIIISPLAFVAYLLPSTEKYFDRWRGLFMTMMVVFPAFSLIFGGAQLAGLAIIYGADPESYNYYNIIVLGMAVQVAPVIITPLLVKLSGSLLGRIAGIVNNPNRGLVDRTRKFAQERHDMRKNRQLWERDESGTLKHNNPLAWGGRRIALRNKNRAHQLKAWESGEEATYKNDRRYHDTHMQEELNTLNATIGEQEAKRDYARQVAQSNDLRRLDVQSRLYQDQAALESDRNATYYEALKAKPGIANAAIRDLANDAEEVSADKKSEQYRKDAVTRVQDDNYHGRLANNEAMQQRAGYVEVDEFGPLRVRATALAKIAAASGDRIKNYSIALDVDNVSEHDKLELALGRSAAGIEINEEAQEAAITNIIESGHVEPMITLNQHLNLTTTGSESIRKAFASAMKKSGMKPKFVPTSQLNDAVPQGLDPADLTNYGDALVNKWIVGAVRNHKYDVGGLSQTDPDDINFVRSVFSDRTNGVFNQLQTMRNEGGELVLDVMRRDIRDIFKDPRVYTNLGNRADPLRLLAREIGGLTDDDLRPDPRPPTRTP